MKQKRVAVRPNSRKPKAPTSKRRYGFAASKKGPTTKLYRAQQRKIQRDVRYLKDAIVVARAEQRQCAVREAVEHPQQQGLTDALATGALVGYAVVMGLRLAWRHLL